MSKSIFKNMFKFILNLSFQVFVFLISAFIFPDYIQCNGCKEAFIMVILIIIFDIVLIFFSTIFFGLIKIYKYEFICKNQKTLGISFAIIIEFCSLYIADKIYDKFSVNNVFLTYISFVLLFLIFNYILKEKKQDNQST